MASRLLDHAAALQTFVQTAETGSFSAAARTAGTTPSAVSKGIARLERALGCKLLRRSTRGLSLTAEGRAFQQRIAPALLAIEESADAVNTSGALRGRMRTSMPTELGRLLMGPLTSKFLAHHPALDMELVLTDRHVDLVREGYDVVFRVGQVGESQLRVRALARLDMALVASPAFLRTWGVPDSAEGLQELPFARYVLGGRPQPIHFADGTSMMPRGRIDLDSGFGVRMAALQGVGLAYLLKCTVQEDLDQGLLVQVLPQLAGPSLPLQALHPFGIHPPAKIGRLADFIAQELQASN